MKTKKPKLIKPAPVFEFAACTKCHGSGKSKEYRCEGMLLAERFDGGRHTKSYQQCTCEGTNEVEFDDGSLYHCCGRHLAVLTRLIEKESNDEFTLIKVKEHYDDGL